MSYSLLEVTLKERVHPKLWLAEFHPTSASHGKRLYTLLLSAVYLLDMKGFELFHWKFQDDFLWEILRTLVSYDWTPVIIGCTCILVRYIRSLCGTGAPINGLILDELPWHHVVCLLIRCVVISVSLSSPIHHFTLIWFFIIFLHFLFLCSFWHIEMLAVPLSLFSGCHFFLLQSYLLRVLFAFFLDCKRRKDL